MGDESGVISGFKFHAYKVDNFVFELEKKLNILALREMRDIKSEINLALRPPLFFEKDNVYVSGIGSSIVLYTTEEENRVNIASITANVTGMFSTNKRYSTEQEEAIVKYQLPTILFPYLRGTITSFLANAGLGSFVFPLINVPELAEKTIKDIEVVPKESKSPDAP